MPPAPVEAQIVAALCRDGVAVHDRFLEDAELHALAACAEARHARGEFNPAGIGRGRSRQAIPRIRGDSICWLAQPAFAAETALLAGLESLRLALNRQTMLGLFDLELHYARYPPGAGYERHVDQHRGRTERQVSLALYLNPGWTAEAGGALRLYGDGLESCDIAPLGGRLVCFFTAQREHAVLPAARTRWSLSGWFRTRT